jgi:hypothetical protein
MIRFLSFLTERSTGRIYSNRKHERDIDPYIAKQGEKPTPTHTMAVDRKGIKAGTRVSIIKKEDINGVTHVHIKPEGSDQVAVVRPSVLHKPHSINTGKGGFEYENKVHNGFQSAGIGPTGATSGGNKQGVPDTVISGRNGKQHSVEIKSGGVSKFTFGQSTIKFTKSSDPATPGSWSFDQKAKTKNPHQTTGHEEHGVVDHMNQHHNPDGGNVTRTKTKLQRPTDQIIKLSPQQTRQHLKNYFKDNKADLVHIEGHGTYHTGEREDPTGFGFPSIYDAVEGHVKVRHKNPGENVRTVQFIPTKIKKSPIDLTNPEHAARYREHIGA